MHCKRRSVVDARHRWRLDKRAAEILSLVSLLLLVGCGSTQPKYYTLTPWPGVPQGGGPLNVEVQTPVVADYLKRDYIVLNNTDYQLHLAQSAAWAEPLSDAIGRNLALDLSQRLPGSNVYTANSGFATAAKASVAINVSRFAEGASGRAEINAMVSVQRPDASTADIRSLHFVMSLADKSTGALVASLSQLLGQMADDIAKDLRALAPTR